MTRTAAAYNDVTIGRIEFRTRTASPPCETPLTSLAGFWNEVEIEIEVDITRFNFVFLRLIISQFREGSNSCSFSLLACSPRMFHWIIVDIVNGSHNMIHHHPWIAVQFTQWIELFLDSSSIRLLGSFSWIVSKTRRSFKLYPGRLSIRIATGRGDICIQV